MYKTGSFEATDLIRAVIVPLAGAIAVKEVRINPDVELLIVEPPSMFDPSQISSVFVAVPDAALNAHDTVTARDEIPSAAVIVVAVAINVSPVAAESKHAEPTPGGTTLAAEVSRAYPVDPEHPVPVAVEVQPVLSLFQELFVIRF
jgi:hypothetical protein